MRRRNGDFNPHLPYGRWQGRPTIPLCRNHFHPHLPYGRWRHSSIVTWQAYTFQSTPSLQKMTTTAVNDVYDFFISIHTFLAEGDNKLAVARYTLAVFQSTPSLQKVTWIEDSYTVSVTISIHTFLAEGDGSRMSVWRAIPNFNPHLPCGRWHLDLKSQSSSTNFNPHLPRGRWQRHRKYYTRCNAYFNPHLPRGRWQNNLNVTLSINIFQSTPSSRKVTCMDTNQLGQKEISIHTFLAEGDDTTRDRIQMLEPFQSTPSSRKVTLRPRSDMSDWTHFNPHLPRGRWPAAVYMVTYSYEFQSTPSSRKVTGRWPIDSEPLSISIHTFLAEGDLDRLDAIDEYVISIHTFLAEGDVSTMLTVPKGDDFNPHLPRGRWLQKYL